MSMTDTAAAEAGMTPEAYREYVRSLRTRSVEDRMTSRSLYASRDAAEMADEIRSFGNGTGRGSSGPTGATYNQQVFVAKLTAERGLEVVESRMKSVKAASAYIDWLLKQPRAQTAQTAQTADTADARRRNRYEGRCVRCGQMVPAEAGFLVKDASGRWAADHDGPCPEKAPEPVLADVPEGHYAIASTGTNDLAFYRVDRPEDGRVFVKLIVGGHPDRNVRRDQVAGILDRIMAAGVTEAATLYGQEIGRCYRCNRHLTDETSRQLGIGPDCRSKL